MKACQFRPQLQFQSAWLNYMAKNKIVVCDHCGNPMIWTFAFAYKEYLCLNCGDGHGALGTETVDETPELKYKLKIYKKIWTILYGSGWFLPRSSYQHSKCRKCKEGNERCNHNDHLSKSEILKNKVATEIFEKLTK